jgi:hypothetical protein
MEITFRVGERYKNKRGDTVVIIEQERMKIVATNHDVPGGLTEGVCLRVYPDGLAWPKDQNDATVRREQWEPFDIVMYPECPY